MKTLYISETLLEQIRDAARRSIPYECCGLIEGIKIETGWQAIALHETKNLAANKEKQFLVDPAEQLRLQRELRGTDRSIIGCYHSHPEGRAAPSASDVAQAYDKNFLWLIAGVEGIRAFLFDGNAVAEVRLN